MAPRAGLVSGQRAAVHLGRRADRPVARPQLHLVRHRDHPRRAHRHAVHGVPLSSGAEARPAADDPVTRAVRLLRLAPAGCRRRVAVHRLQRLQHDPRRRRDPVAVPRNEHVRGRSAGGHPLRRPDHRRVSLHPRRAAVGNVAVHPRVRDLHHRVAVQRDAARALVRHRPLPHRTVPGPVRRGRQLPVDLGAVRIGVLALPARGHADEHRVLVDLLGLGGRRADDAARRVHPFARHRRWRR